MISGGSPICRHWYVSHNPWGGCPLKGEYLRISRALLCLLSKIFCCHRISEGAIFDSCSRSATLSDRSCKDSFRPSPPPPRQRNCSPHGTPIPEKSRAKPFHIRPPIRLSVDSITRFRGMTRTLSQLGGKSVAVQISRNRFARGKV